MTVDVPVETIAQCRAAARSRAQRTIDRMHQRRPGVRYEIVEVDAQTRRSTAPNGSINNIDIALTVIVRQTFDAPGVCSGRVYRQKWGYLSTLRSAPSIESTGDSTQPW